MAAKAATKSEILTAVAKETELSRKQVAAVFTALSCQIGSAVGKKGAGVFTVPVTGLSPAVRKSLKRHSGESGNAPSCSMPAAGISLHGSRASSITLRLMNCGDGAGTPSR